MHQPESSYSTAMWVRDSLGFYGVLFAVIGLGLLAVSCLTVFKVRRPATIAACMTLVPIPLLIGAIGLFHSIIRGLTHLSLSPNRLDNLIASVIVSAVVIPVAGLFAALPSLCVLSGGLIFRTIQKRTIEN